MSWNAIKSWARRLKTEVRALHLAARDPRVPFAPKLVAAAVVAYALSPIDLIPDFIPILGYLDDVVIVPLGIIAAVKLVPDELMQEFRARAAESGRRPASYAGAIGVATLWIAAGVALAAWWWLR
jgi:uncharacterized membrane protein YkvA (DUF1232 family)